MNLKDFFSSIFIDKNEPNEGDHHQQSSVCKTTLAKVRLASSPNTCPKTLSRLAHSKNKTVLLRLAENPNVEDAVLERLASHDCADVRGAVAENDKTPLRILMILASDEDADVRYSLAENHNVPPVVLVVLADDDNPYVSCRAEQTLIRIGIRKASKVFQRSSWFTARTDLRQRRQGLGSS